MAKIYTRHGDDGYSSLLGGARLPKSHIRFHAYGTIDELNAQIGLLLSQILPEHSESIIPILNRIQNDLFVAGGVLACNDFSWLLNLPRLTEEHPAQLEQEIDQWNSDLEPLKNFILPGGCPSALSAHIARTVCRRAERWTYEVVEQSPEEFKKEFSLILKYLNRLSDHLFVLSRWLNFKSGNKETLWIP